MMKKFLSLLLALLLCVGMVTTASALTEGHDYTITDGALVIKDGVAVIDAYAFADNSTITSVTIPASVEAIAHYAFYGCSSLVSVTYEGTTEPTSGSGVFARTSVFAVNVPADYTGDSFCGYDIERAQPEQTAPTITVEFQPNNQITTEGKILEGLVYHVKVSDGSTPSYQWYQCDDANGTNAKKLEGATGRSFDLPKDLKAGTYYFYSIASADGAESVTSRVSTVTVKVAHNIKLTAEPAEGGTVAAKVGSGNVTQAIEDTRVTLSVTANDGYQFKEWQVISGGVTVTGNQLLMGAEDVEIKAIFESTSAPAPTFTVEFEPMNQGTTEGNIIEALLYQVSVSDGSTPSYQWYQCDDANKTNARKMEGATGKGFDLPKDLKAGTYYFYCIASADGAESVTSRVSTVTVNAPSVTLYTITVTIDGNGTAFASAASAAANSEVTLTAPPNDGYRFKEWQVVSGGITVTDNKFTMGTSDVEIKAIFEQIPAVPPTPVDPNPIPAPVPFPEVILPTEAQIVTVYEGDTATMCITAQYAGIYEWYIDRGDGKGFVLIPGENDASYTTSNVTARNDGYRYLCVVRNAYGVAESPIFTLDVLELVELPQTGTDSYTALWMALSLASWIALAFVLYAERKRKA